MQIWAEGAAHWQCFACALPDKHKSLNSIPGAAKKTLPTHSDLTPPQPFDNTMDLVSTILPFPDCQRNKIEGNRPSTLAFTLCIQWQVPYVYVRPQLILLLT